MSSRALVPLIAACILPLACALPVPLRQPASDRTGPAVLRVSSNNHSMVDVYLLCGDRDALWVGAVAPRDFAEMEIPAERLICARGLNFFVVDQRLNRGYWVGPVRPVPGEQVNLLIEKYAGLSTASLSRGMP